MKTCKCGCKKFETAKYNKFTYTIDRCINCGRIYEFEGKKRSELNLTKAFNQYYK